MRIETWHVVQTDMAEVDMEALGNRIAIVIDAKEETFGNGIIERVADFTARPLMGTVVVLGDDVTPKKAEKLQPGTRVLFNRIGATIDSIDLPSGEREIAFLSVLDVYLRWDE